MLIVKSREGDGGAGLEIAFSPVILSIVPILNLIDTRTTAVEKR